MFVGWFILVWFGLVGVVMLFWRFVGLRWSIALDVDLFACCSVVVVVLWFVLFVFRFAC